ncbi:Flagellar hook-associated protein FliD [hydrothermal vent metagenome]|uniref:Filament cap protein n=1 Tax=hydrothermal vent metagenome TaxID=652676 RepID=A0A1W1BHR8_9ZZZZ
MAGTINSLGVGSGVLTADMIDKLKTNEKKVLVDPIEKKVKLNEQKTQALDLLKSLMTTLKSNTSALSDDTMFSHRTVKGNNSSVEVSAEDGVAVQSFSISDISLAKESVQQSDTFNDPSATIASDNGVMNLAINGEVFDIEYNSGMTLEDFRDEINNVAGDTVTASILQVGDNQYSLIVKSDATGEAQNITMTDKSGNLDTKLTNKTFASGDFDTVDDAIADADGSLTIDIGGGSVSSTINYTNGMTLTELKDAINSDETLKGSIVATIIEDENGKQNLVLNAIGSEDGADISITDNDSGLDSRITSLTQRDGSVSEVQSAKDATFTYNGINLTRSSNTIDDITPGVTINLLSESSSANISIEQDREPIKDELQNFVTSYNSMIEQLDKMTLADKEEGKVGVFNGDSSIRNLGRELTRLITSYDEDGNSLSQFGISLNQDGKLSFNSSDFDKMMDQDPESLQKFFTGETTVDEYGNEHRVDGIFDKLNEKLKNSIGYGGSISILSEGLDKEKKSLEENYQRSLDLLNQRYDTMTARFVEYDSIIAKLNNQSAALLQQIEMAINAKN